MSRDRIYVEEGGRAGATGKSWDPFGNVRDAVKSSEKGDLILVRDGTYDPFYVDRQVTIRAVNEHGAKIDASGHPGRNGIHIAANNVTIDGFDVFGSVSSAGIAAYGVKGGRITDNKSHHNGGSGIYTKQCDDFLIEGNETYKNATAGASSGISVHRSANLTTPGQSRFDNDFDFVIRDNYSHHNFTQTRGKHTDGNGIILDDNRTTKNPDQPEYNGHFLVEGNHVEYNGGVGILDVWSDHARIEGNLVRMNNRDLNRTGSSRAEIEVRNSSDVEVLENIAISSPRLHPENHALGSRHSPSYDNQDVSFVRNHAWSGVGIDPMLLTPGDIYPDMVGNIFTAPDSWGIDWSDWL